MYYIFFKFKNKNSNKCRWINRYLFASSMNGRLSFSVSTFHSAPSLLLISELCIFGFSWAILRLWPLDQTMKAFIGRFTWFSMLLMLFKSMFKRPDDFDRVSHIISCFTSKAAANNSDWSITTNTPRQEVFNDAYFSDIHAWTLHF